MKELFPRLEKIKETLSKRYENKALKILKELVVEWEKSNKSNIFI